MFGLVANIEEYPKFLPWCVGARVRKREGNVVFADLIIGFKMLREKFTSRVQLSPNRIDTEYAEGPFRYLHSHWIFTPLPNECDVDFFVDFELRSRLLQQLIGVVFSEAVRHMITSFETQARTLYGNTKLQQPQPLQSGQQNG